MHDLRWGALRMPARALVVAGLALLTASTPSAAPGKRELALLALLTVKKVDDAAVCGVPRSLIQLDKYSYHWQNGRLTNQETGKVFVLCPTNEDMYTDKVKVLDANSFYSITAPSVRELHVRLAAFTCPAMEDSETYDYPLLARWTSLEGVAPSQFGFAEGLKGQVLSFDRVYRVSYARQDLEEQELMDAIVTVLEKRLRKVLIASSRTAREHGYIATFPSSRGPCVRFTTP